MFFSEYWVGIQTFHRMTSKQFHGVDVYHVHQRFGTHEDVYWRTAAQDAYGAGILALVSWLQIEGVDVAIFLA